MPWQRSSRGPACAKARSSERTMRTAGSPTSAISSISQTSDRSTPSIVSAAPWRPRHSRSRAKASSSIARRAAWSVQSSTRTPCASAEPWLSGASRTTSCPALQRAGSVPSEVGRRRTVGCHAGFCTAAARYCPVVHVGLNLVFLVPGEQGGMEIYARELIDRLAQRDDVRLTAFAGRAAAELDWPAELRLIDVDARSRVQWVRGEQQLLPPAAARAGVEVVHSLASTAPLWGRFRRVTTVHDLNYKLIPEAHFGVRALGMRALVPAAARRSHRIITATRSAAGEIVEHLRVPEAKIDVVPHGLGLTRAVAPTPEAELRARLGLDSRPVVLAVSARRPHKNLARLLGAVARIPAARRPTLVMPGYPTTHEDELRERARSLGIDDDVRFLGWVSEADLEGLYGLAAASVFPSLREGFGLPLLEAMARSVPVATSDRGSLAEVAGDAAVLFDPEREEDIAAAVERLLQDGELAERLRAAGPARAATFTWERAAELTVASYRRACANAGGDGR